MKIAVIGTGYVGLVAGACFAENGNDVVCVDKDEAKVRLLRRGKMPDLRARARGDRQAEPRREAPDVHDPPARRPCGASTSSSSPSARRRARTARPTCSTCSAWPRDIARAMNGYKVIVDKSTVPVGTAAKVREIVAPRDDAPVQRGQQPGVPEAGRGDRRLPEARPRRHRRRGRPRAAEMMRELYAPFTRTGAPVMVMDCASAELCKYAANAHAGHAHLVHERDRERVRARSAPTSTRCAGRRLRPAHRLVVPVPRRRLRRQLLPEGRQGDRASSRRTQATTSES